MRRCLAGPAMVIALLSTDAAFADPATVDPVNIEAPRFEDLAPAGPSLAERLGEIRRRVQAALVYPELARARGVEGEARVGFEIDADGAPRNVAVVTSSGSRSLDRAAKRALLDAGALPYVSGRVIVPVHFGLVGD